MKKEPFFFKKYKKKRLCPFNSAVATPVANRQTEAHQMRLQRRLLVGNLKAHQKSGQLKHN